MENRKNNKLIFWTIQLLLWVTFLGFIFIPPMFNPQMNVLGYEKWQMVLDYTMFLIAILCIIGGLRYFFNKIIDFENLKTKDFVKIIIAFIASFSIYYFFIIGYNYFMLTYIYKRPEVLSHPTQSVKNNIVVLIALAILMLEWIVFYIAIKATTLLNENRLNRLELEANLKESQLNTLKGQINPHFMFNSLNNIRGLMLEDVDKARNMLTNLSETLRYSLTKSGVDSIALEDELEMVENYVEISKIQFENRLQFEMNIDKASLNTQIPPMIIQMLVENAIKHGISNLKEGGKVSLSTTIKDSQLQIEVVNNGNLQQSESSTQVGLENIKKRLELLYGEESTFSLKEIENQVVATIKIPLT